MGHKGLVKNLNLIPSGSSLNSAKKTTEILIWLGSKHEKKLTPLWALVSMIA